MKRLGIATPIIQAPMAGVTMPALAAVVSNAGGLGSLGVGTMNAEAVRKAIRETRALTDKPFNINVFWHSPARADAALEQAWLDWLAPVFAQFDAKPPQALSEIYTSFVDEAMLKMFAEEKPAVVSFHFGLPSKAYIDALRGAGITLIASATNLREAQQVADAGLDAIVAQGIEAGGYRGVFDSTTDDDGLGVFAFTRLIAMRFDVPVIAAAQLGTAFVPCTETSIDAGYRRAILSEAANSTTFTAAISGRVARSLANKFTALGWHDDTPASPAYPSPAYPITYDAGKALHAAAKAKGKFGYGTQWAGQTAALAREMPAAELMAKLRAELQASIKGLQRAAASLMCTQ
ncbi:Enoyl-[acyl-carrier-protein] reductase [FMN] [Candidatus Paraburkholderia calva]|nr:Enoyl-[acyl-carrier-protein] reductase [FMN] [Candidatus Paraburkholderia calva]